MDFSSKVIFELRSENAYECIHAIIIANRVKKTDNHIKTDLEVFHEVFSYDQNSI